MAAKKENSRALFTRLIAEIRSLKLKPVYYLCGEEEFYLSRLTEAFSKVIPAHEKDFNFDLLYGQDLSLSKLLSLAKSYPMMAERRLIIVRNFQQLSKTAEDTDAFLQYLKQPNTTCLLVLFDTAKPAANTRLGKALLSGKEVGFYQFEPLQDYLLPDWVTDWTHAHYKQRITPAAAQLLAQFVGNNLQLLAAEIDKVCTYASGTEQITEKEVRQVIGSYREYTVIELKDAVMKRNLEHALYISEQMLQHAKTDAGEIIRLIGFFTSVFTNIWQILRLREKRLSKNQIQAELGISSSWYFNKLWDDAVQFNYAEMPGIFEALLDADRSVKGFSTLDSTAIIFFLVRRIVSGT